MDTASSQSRILVVEDEPLSRDMLTRRLERRGFSVTAVGDGAGCLSVLGFEGDGGVALPDVVLLDVQMPGMTGLETLRQIRTRHSHDALPVIMVTALGETDDIVVGLEAGASDYVVKPVVFPVLLARISVALRISRSVRLLVEAERQRVVIAALGEACHQLSQPMQATIMTLEGLIQETAAGTAMRDELRQVLSWTTQVSDVIHRLQQVATLRSLPFTERMEILDKGTPADQGIRPR